VRQNRRELPPARAFGAHTARMARRADAIAENAPGELFVDSSCIDCDLCRQLAPAVFARQARRGQSYVAHQPADDAERHRALMALVTCPTSSIGTTTKLDTRAAAAAFPEPVDGLPDVLFCGYASADSYGASSWLVRRPDGNVLVDSPRWAAALADRIAALGGVRTMVLTHRDDVADHDAWHRRFGCERVIHAADVSGDTAACERIVDGETRLAPDLLVIPVPGHTRGSVALLHGDVLFSGDHVWATDDQQGLECGRDVCWYSWPEQRRSIEKLAAHDFTHVLPGHGRRFHAASPAAMRAELARLARAMA
jgi:glyoxylase-like metal-dependent hydrolase (beta-lactamase superfamily II)/ferredoxin